MRRPGISICLLLAALAGTATAQDDLFKFVSRIPQCGLSCILQEVPLSACNSLTNTTCICSDEDLRAATQDCVLERCESPLDGIETAKVEAEACQRPYRDRRKALWAPISIEALAFIAVWMRLYGRWSTINRFESDDWIMLVCVILYIPFWVLGQYVGQLAFGRDVWTVDPNDIMKGLKLFYVAESFYLVILALTKISLLCFFLRIFPNPKFRWATYATMLMTGMATTVFVFMQIFQCIPIRYNWERLMGQFGPHRCLDVNTLAYTAAAFSIAQDVIILVLPLPLLFGLNMSWRSKAGILLMFSLGVFILITSCIRLQYLVLFARSANPTWDYSDALIWTGLEVAVSMIVTSLPAIRVLLSRVVPGVFSTIISKAGLSGHSGSGRSGRKSGTGNTSLQSRAGAGDAKSGDHRQQQQRQQEQGQDQQQPEEVHHHYRQDEEQPAHQATQFHLRVPRSKFSIYNLGAGRRGRNESEEALELGDRIQGDVHTEIGVADWGGDNTDRGRPVYGEDPPRHSSVESGIHVHTTTTFDSLRGHR